MVHTTLLPFSAMAGSSVEIKKAKINPLYVTSAAAAPTSRQTKLTASWLLEAVKEPIFPVVGRGQNLS